MSVTNMAPLFGIVAVAQCENNDVFESRSSWTQQMKATIEERMEGGFYGETLCHLNLEFYVP